MPCLCIKMEIYFIYITACISFVFDFHSWFVSCCLLLLASSIPLLKFLNNVTIIILGEEHLYFSDDKTILVYNVQ